MTHDNKQHDETVSPECPKSTSASRRRLLLSGCSKGALVLAASTPLKTLASTSVFTNPGKDGAAVIRCGISGMQSGVHSRDVVETVCGGYSPGKYKKRENWPVLPSPWTPDTPCKVVFSGCVLTVPNLVDREVCTDTTRTTTKRGKNITVTSTNCVTQQVVDGTRDASLLEVMTDGSNTDEFHWITAWLNGISRPPFNFPYSGPEVLALYYGRSVGGITFTKEAALNFFKTYMELHPE